MARDPAKKAAYDKARYHLVREKKVVSAQHWYRRNKEAKQAYDIARRPTTAAAVRSRPDTIQGITDENSIEAVA